MPGAAHDRATDLAAATDLLELAMHESHGPVDVLGGALERMATALSQCARAIERQRSLDPRGSAGVADSELEDLEVYRAALEREIALCIECLQFHDRLMQRLARVGSYLAGLTGDSCAGTDPRRANLSEGSIELF